MDISRSAPAKRLVEAATMLNSSCPAAEKKVLVLCTKERC
jgi:hypothetical protein